MDDEVEGGDLEEICELEEERRPILRPRRSLRRWGGGGAEHFGGLERGEKTMIPEVFLGEIRCIYLETLGSSDLGETDEVDRKTVRETRILRRDEKNH